MLVSDAANRLGMNVQTLRLALQQRLFPFGEAIKTSENRYTYFINEKAFERYLEGYFYEKDSMCCNNCSIDDRRVLQ